MKQLFHLPEQLKAEGRVVVVVQGSQFLFYFDSRILWGPDHFPTLPSFAVLSALPQPFLCSFLFLFHSVVSWLLRVWPQIAELDIPAHFFPSSRFAKTKAKSLGSRSFQMLYSPLTAHVPLSRGLICARGSHGTRGKVSTIQPILPLIYFIPKHKTTELKNLCI